MDALPVLCLVCSLVAIVSGIYSTFWVYYYMLPKRNHAVFRARRVRFLILLFIVGICQMMFRPIISFLYLESMINVSIYRVGLSLFALLGTLLFASIRVWLLWYDLNYNRLQKAKLVSKHLFNRFDSNQNINLNSNINTNTKDEKLEIKRLLETNSNLCSCCTNVFVYNHFFGNGLKVSQTLGTIFIIVFLFTVVVILLLKNDNFGLRIAQLFALILLIIYLYLNTSLWLKPRKKKLSPSPQAEMAAQAASETDGESEDESKESKESKESSIANSEYNSTVQLESHGSDSIYLQNAFKDDFNIRYEVTGTFILFIISALTLTVLNGRFGDETNESLFRINVTIAGCLPIIQLFGLFLYTYIPYYTITKIENSKKAGKASLKKELMNIDSTVIVSENNLARMSVGLLDTLSHQNGFHWFVEHLVQEFSLENLSFLVELWQFKYWDYTNNKLNKQKNKKKNKEKYKENGDNSDHERNILTSSKIKGICLRKGFSVRRLKLSRQKSRTKNETSKTDNYKSDHSEDEKQPETPKTPKTPADEEPIDAIEIIGEDRMYESNTIGNRFQLRYATPNDLLLQIGVAQRSQGLQESQMSQTTVQTTPQTTPQHPNYLGQLTQDMNGKDSKEQPQTTGMHMVKMQETRSHAHSVATIQSVSTAENSVNLSLNLVLGDTSYYSDNDISHDQNSVQTDNDNDDSLQLYDFSQLSYSQSRAKDVQIVSKMLQSLPWYLLPFGNGMKSFGSRNGGNDNFNNNTNNNNNSNNNSNEILHCIYLFNTYISSDGYDCLNISNASCLEIEANLRSLIEFKSDIKNELIEKTSFTKTKNRLNDDLRAYGISIHAIKNQTQFEKRLKKCFDVALVDVFDNLHNSFSRFQTKDRYFLLQAEKIAVIKKETHQNVK